MKNIKAFLIAFIFTLFSFAPVLAQASESIWLEAGNTSYKTEELVTVQVHGASSTLIQGFTFQIRYDPNCLKPLNASSPIAGMNGLQLPQNSGLVDASFASSSPQPALGILAEVSFQALGACQTELYLETAALAVRNQAGFAEALPDVALGQRQILVAIDSQIGQAQAPQQLGESLSLEPVDATPVGNIWADRIVPVLIILAFFAGLFLLGVGALVFYKRSAQTTR